MAAPIPDGEKGKYDIAVSINSVLPEEREEIPKMLRGIRGRLEPGGLLLAIFPSYDTTEYLCWLWRERYERTHSKEHAERIVCSFRQAKKMDFDRFVYADDGRTAQCYHTEETISKELKQAGFEIDRTEKIYYPWELVRKYDYGYFPDAEEEIWDWFVVARRTAGERSVPYHEKRSPEHV